MKNVFRFILAGLILFLADNICFAQKNKGEFLTVKNGQTLYDTDGNVLHAHGGWILKAGDTWYWYGENRKENNYVSCYASKDLVNWQFRNNILTVDSKIEGIRVRTEKKLWNEESDRKVNIERPKVFYNKETGKYIMWAHYENGKDYSFAGIALASCDTPDGNFTYHGSFKPFGQMSRDCTIYEENGKTYFASAARNNGDMNVYLLQKDGLNIKKQTGSWWQGEYREAPAFVKVNKRIYCFNSGCTGWDPNQGQYAFTENFEDGFDVLSDFGDSTTFSSQPAFILTLKGTKTTSYIYVGDRWGGSGKYHQSTYTWFPLHFEKDGSAWLEYCDELKINAVTGEIEPVVYK